jgi:hypothetical protein
MLSELKGLRPILPLSWSWRIGLGLVSILGTAAWAMSFDPSVRVLAIGIGLAAGLGWIGLGIAILLFRPGKLPVANRADLCLQTQVLGITVLIFHAASNLLPSSWPWQALDLPLLPAADAMMCIAFIFSAGRMNVSCGKALALWLVGLHGFFATGFLAFFVVAGRMR